MSTWRRPLCLLLRLFIGAILALTGIGKLLDVPGFIEVLRTYKTLHEALLYPTAVGLILTELKLAECFLFKIHLLKAAWCSVFLHIIFTAWATFHVLAGANIPNCGCFGVFWARPLTWTTVGEDLFMTFVSVSLLYLLKTGDEG